MAERIAIQETDPEILAAYLNSMRRLSHSDPERCEAMLTIVKGRLDIGFGGSDQGREPIQNSLGGWTAQLFVGQGRAPTCTWFEEWVSDPERYADLLDSFASSLREAFFHRYTLDADAEARAMCDRAQEGLAVILSHATRISDEAYRVLASDAAAADKQAAGKRYSAAEKVIHHAMNQLYFGSGAREAGRGLINAAAKERFLVDYADIPAIPARVLQQRDRGIRSSIGTAGPKRTIHRR